MAINFGQTPSSPPFTGALRDPTFLHERVAHASPRHLVSRISATARSKAMILHALSTLRRRGIAALPLAFLASLSAASGAEIAHRIIDAAGGRANGGLRYQNYATLGGISGHPAPEGYQARNGYLAELYEPVTFTLVTPRTLLDEREVIQLTATLGLDDGSLLRLQTAEITWHISGSPLMIGPTGLLNVGNVFQDTTVQLTATYAAFAKALSLHIRNSGIDDFGLYAGDGIDDTWQIRHYGLNNPAGIATADPSGTGQNNLFKFLAGLDPLDPAARFVLKIRPGGDGSSGGPTHPGSYALDFGPCRSGHSYSIYTSENLTEWSLLHQQIATESDYLTLGDTSPAASKKFYRVEPGRYFPSSKKVAIMGDSISAQGSTSPTFLNANGYYSWARLFNQGRWELVQNGSRWCFATGGKRSDEVSALHRSEVIASDADTCVILYGTNDAFQLIPTSVFIAQAISDWQALKAEGITPVATTVLPMGSIGNDDARRQARVAEYNSALRLAASAHQVVLCDWTTLLEKFPGSNNGVALDSYFPTNDFLHPKPFPCSLLGRALAATIANNFALGSEVWDNSSWITPNVQFSGTNGKPDQWTIYSPAGATLIEKNLIPSPEGSWWEFTMVKGNSTGNFSINSFEANIGGPPSGKSIEAITELQVIEGSLNHLYLGLFSNGTLAATMFGNLPEGAQLKPTDGVVVLRTLPAIFGNNSVPATPGLYFSSGEGTTRRRVRRCGVREISP
jgi:hypothetical protein